MKEQRSASGKIGNSLVALSSAAILTVYTAGYLRTKSAADRLTVPAAQRRPANPRASSGQASTGARPRPDASRSIDPAPVPETRPAPSPQLSSAAAKTPEVAVAIPAPGAQPDPVAPQAPTQAVDSAAPALAAAPDALPTAAAEATAKEPAAAPAAAEAPYKDGTFVAWGFCQHGGIEATVVVERGQLVSAKISYCDTRYPCSMIKAAPPQVVERQSSDVDYVSGATDSVDAFRQAVEAALAEAH
jgi:uncharacterized protein with FMN-binding domain